MDNLRIYYSQLNGHYFTNERLVICEECKKEIKDMFQHFFAWEKKSYREKSYCLNCSQKLKDKGIVDEKKLVVKVQYIPSDAVPYLFFPPQLTGRKDMSVFEVVSQIKAEADEVIDRTRLAGRESIESAQIGALDMIQIEVKDNKQLSKKEWSGGLQRLKDAMPLLPETERKRLESENASAHH